MSPAPVAGERYRIERRLGGGGMASVHVGRDTELDRAVAVKLLADNLAGDTEVRERFVREAQVAARLAHPNVVAVYDAGEEDGRPYIVMEYVEGETLADTLRRRGPLPPEEAVELVAQACAGLEHAHAAGLVHRDVKPQNLLLRADGTLKVADFGIARATEGTRLTQAGTILGTAAYLAPEQAAGEEVGPPADVYALGAILYELLAGRPPYQLDSLAELARRQAGEPVPPVRDLASQVPAELEDVVMRALARLPEYRPRSAGQLARELRAAVGDRDTEPLEAPTEVLRRPRGTFRSPRALAAAAVAVLCALALGIAAGARSGDGAPPPPAGVEPVPRAGTPEEQARNLAEWLRRNAEPAGP
jgi:eukaryotic-like serine/threonine-protein kinase